MDKTALLDSILEAASLTQSPKEDAQKLRHLGDAVGGGVTQAFDAVIAAEIQAGARLPERMERELEAAWGEPERLATLAAEAVSFLNAYTRARDARGVRPGSVSLGGAR